MSSTSTSSSTSVSNSLRDEVDRLNVILRQCTEIAAQISESDEQPKRVSDSKDFLSSMRHAIDEAQDSANCLLRQLKRMARDLSVTSSQSSAS